MGLNRLLAYLLWLDCTAVHEWAWSGIDGLLCGCASHTYIRLAAGNCTLMKFFLINVNWKIWRNGCIYKSSFNEFLCNVFVKSTYNKNIKTSVFMRLPKYIPYVFQLLQNIIKYYYNILYICFCLLFIIMMFPNWGNQVVEWLEHWTQVRTVPGSDLSQRIFNCRGSVSQTMGGTGHAHWGLRY